MEDYNDIIKELEKPDTLEIMKKIVAKNIEHQRQRSNKINDIVSGIDYIEWLIRFTKDSDGFSDYDWDYADEKLSYSDQEKVNDLHLFFEGIYQYAKNNHIYSKMRALGECYQIKIGDIGFEIGYMTGQGTMFYCKKIAVGDDFIDFMDILTNKKQDNVDLIEKDLTNLSNMITNIYNKGIPFEAIEETINKTMRNIVLEERSGKKLVKKK